MSLLPGSPGERLELADALAGEAAGVRVAALAYAATLATAPAGSPHQGVAEALLLCVTGMLSAEPALLSDQYAVNGLIHRRKIRAWQARAC